MKCPHCLESFTEKVSTIIDIRKFLDLGEDRDGVWKLLQVPCPACNRFIFILQRSPVGRSGVNFVVVDSILVRPLGISRSPLSADVPKEFADDYSEACLVLLASPKASAALSRRCLQHLLREKAGVKHSDLSKEIDEVLSSGKLPSHLADGIDAIRVIGNFAAHPIKSTSTGEVVPVEPGEAEWNLDVLEGLFDFYFISPEQLKKKRDEVNKKLKDAGKPLLK